MAPGVKATTRVLNGSCDTVLRGKVALTSVPPSASRSCSRAACPAQEQGRSWALLEVFATAMLPCWAQGNCRRLHKAMGVSPAHSLAGHSPPLTHEAEPGTFAFPHSQPVQFLQVRNINCPEQFQRCCCDTFPAAAAIPGIAGSTSNAPNPTETPGLWPISYSRVCLPFQRHWFYWDTLRG